MRDLLLRHEAPPCVHEPSPQERGPLGARPGRAGRDSLVRAGRLPTVPGHEPVGRIVAVGDRVRRHRVGERCLIQTDYRHLPTAAANAAFGYNFEGGLQEYVLLDERMIIEPETGERFLIPVGEEPSASAVALVEPWACVEASYVYRERRGPLPGGRMLVVADAGHADRWPRRAARAGPAGPADRPGGRRRRSGRRSRRPGFAVTRVADLADLPAPGVRRHRLLRGRCRPGSRRSRTAWRFAGLINVVTGGVSIGRPVALDIGRVHYDLTRWIGTAGASATEGYAAIPADGEVRAGDRMAVDRGRRADGPDARRPGGLGGLEGSLDRGDRHRRCPPRASASGRPGRSPDRAAVELAVVNSRTAEVAPGFSYIALMVPAPALVGQTVALAGSGCRINIFAGFAERHPRGGRPRPLHRATLLLPGHERLRIPDMKAVLRKLESGELDTNISLDAVAGFEGVADALAAVEGRTAAGKIMVYPSLPDLGLVRLSELGERFPTVAAALEDGRWTKAAEQELLRVAGRSEARR